MSGSFKEQFEFIKSTFEAAAKMRRPLNAEQIRDMKALLLREYGAVAQRSPEETESYNNLDAQLDGYLLALEAFGFA